MKLVHLVGFIIKIKGNLLFMSVDLWRGGGGSDGGRL